MIYLAINYKPYTVDFAVFNYESKELLRYGTLRFEEKDTNGRIMELQEAIEKLFKNIKPNVVLTQMLDLRHTLKRDLEHIVQVRTILRLHCINNNIIYNEYRTSGWEKRITELKVPSKKAKLKIAKEYSPHINRTEIANAIILGEGVVWGRLQVGRD